MEGHSRALLETPGSRLAALFVLDFYQGGGRGGKFYVGAEMSSTAPWPFSQPNSSDKWAGLEPGDPQTHLDDFTEISWPVPPRALTSSGCASPPSAKDMANQTNISTPYNSYEYYLDYLDLIPVDERKLKANKYLIVITFWASLAFFVMLLFLILLYMSWSGSSQAR
ncbi:melanocortin-2 receptor accessory protein [Mirounga angustirostris]|uniref:melanocortin-2 receptor accessory protein n=1 Tax=Mirounga angustirostris TaxID=9716 RepID=UPI00313B9E2A